MSAISIKTYPAGTEEADAENQQALAAVSAAARIDEAFASVILGDTTVLQAFRDRNEPALYDLIAAETSGLTAEFFGRDREIPFNFVEVAPSLDYSATGANKLPRIQPGRADFGPLDGLYFGSGKRPPRLRHRDRRGRNRDPELGRKAYRT